MQITINMYTNRESITFRTSLRMSDWTDWTLHQDGESPSYTADFRLLPIVKAEKS